MNKKNNNKMKRFLNKKDIDYILENFFSFFPEFLDKDIIDVTLSQIRNQIINELSSVEVEEQNIDLLKKNIEEMIIKSIIPFGESVGVITAQSLGEKQTQLTLNSFHSAGLSLSTVVTGVPRFLEILNLSKEPKNAQNTFFFKKQNIELHTMKNILSQKIKAIRLKNLIVSKTISIKETNDYFYEAFFHFFPSKTKFTKYVSIVYQLNKEKIYRNNIDFFNLKKKIEDEFEEMIVLFSPLHLCQLHILINYEKILELLDEFKKDDEYFCKNIHYFLEIFYEDYLRNRIESMLLSGLSKIDDFSIEKTENDSLIVQTQGSNMQELLKLSFIDKKTLKSNDVWEIYHLMGIEGCRKFLIEELTKIVNSDGGFINQCHITLLVDTMTVTGNLTSISRYGIKKEKGSVMARSSFEESLEHFIKAGFFSEIEKVKSVSASVMCGKHCNLGSGLPEIIANFPVLNNLYSKSSSLHSSNKSSSSS